MTPRGTGSSAECSSWRRSGGRGPPTRRCRARWTWTRGASGWRIAPEDLAERHGLSIRIALGESIVAIGTGAGFDLTTGVIAAAVLGIVVVTALWWLYFDVAAIFARGRLLQATGLDRARL